MDKNQIRLAIICDYLEENWQSMNFCSEMLLKHLQTEHNTYIQAIEVRPEFNWRFGKIPLFGLVEQVLQAKLIIGDISDRPLLDYLVLILLLL